jgi:dihydrofolate reductase
MTSGTHGSSVVRLQAEFIEAGALDTLDMFVVPLLLGDGVRMFPRGGPARTLRLHLVEGLGKGMVRLSYLLT